MLWQFRFRNNDELLYRTAGRNPIVRSGRYSCGYRTPAGFMDDLIRVRTRTLTHTHKIDGVASVIPVSSSHAHPSVLRTVKTFLSLYGSPRKLI